MIIGVIVITGNGAGPSSVGRFVCPGKPHEIVDLRSDDVYLAGEELKTSLSRFPIVYVWLAYYTCSFAAIPVAERNPHSVRPFVLCLFVSVVAPVALG